MSRENLKKHVNDAAQHLEIIEALQAESERVSSFNVSKKMELAEQAVRRSVSFSRSVVSALREIQEA